METNVLKLENVSVYQKEIMVLDQVTFEVQKGEFVYFIGKTGFLDHTFIQNKPNLYLFIHGKCLVSEPYHLTMKDVKELIKFCEENGLNFYIDGLSFHYPGHTLRIVIWKGERDG